MATSTERDRLEQVLRGQSDLLDQVHQWLEEDAKQEDILRAVILSSRNPRTAHLDRPDPARIFSTEAIRSMCIKYRLRFLDAGLFKGGIPRTALQAVRALERSSDGPLTGFKIMAPAERFKLCDSEVDPLLFVPVGDDRYYLVHKWGNDLSAQRVLLGLPFRSPVHLGLSVLTLAVLVTMLMPVELIGGTTASGLFSGTRLLFLFWSTMVLSAFTAFGWLAFFGQFSERSWNSRYFND